ncbi:TRAP transporter substrate-binding protein DctP [Roseivivax sp. GX 12232]|uniref:TRAP transporter substrate-binding protein DctP n=1 Tax=Roseivivax sp. GX 12232 TaxID=2900547 RepID=UPI001E30EB4B|nr:TRAP transporter substrate-binding protein DctP [Roseivivax sp. GX 12232]MCE0505871.1 TRAP transporter substrate-binding protein DctP [Roseivivax sp. GX 12232]
MELRKTFAASAALLAMGAGAASADDMRLKLAGVVPAEHFGNQILEEVVEEIEGADVGLSVTLFPSGQLGSGEELFEDASRGNVDLVHSVIYAQRDPVLEINSLPYLVSSFDEMEATYLNSDSAFNQIFAERLDMLGLKLLANAPEGFIGVVAEEVPENAASLGDKGMNIRVWSSQVIKSTVETMGFNATTMNWGEVFAAMQSGTVDGAICCTAQLAYTAFATSDVGSVFVPYGAVVENTTYYASAETWEEMNDAQREVVQTAFDNAAEKYFAFAKENEASYLSKLEETGYEVVELSDAERGAIAETVRAEVWPGIAEIVGQEVMDQLMPATN